MGKQGDRYIKHLFTHATLYTCIYMVSHKCKNSVSSIRYNIILRNSLANLQIDVNKEML